MPPTATTCGYAYCDVYDYSNCDTYGYADCESNSHAYCDTYGHANCNANCNNVVFSNRCCFLILRSTNRMRQDREGQFRNDRVSIFKKT